MRSSTSAGMREAMSALGSSSLGAACRTIYVRAADNHILPPLIRDAADPEPPQRVIEAAGEDFTLVFRVRYDERPRAAAGRFEQPPLRFEIEATAGADRRPTELTEAERFELIRAFMLGVREPVVVETPSETDDWRLAVKLASRFVIWAPRAEPLDVGLSMDEICERLAGRLMDGAEGLFATHRAGVDVWRARLREELFGEPRLAADDLWPVEAPIEDFQAPALSALPALARRRLPPVPVRAPARLSVRRRAVAAAMALLGLAALAGALASQGRRGDAGPVPEAVKTSARSAPVARIAEPSSVTAEASSGPHRQVASLDDRLFWSPAATDARFTALAPAVTRATLALTEPSTMTTPARTPGQAAGAQENDRIGNPGGATERGAQPGKALPAPAVRRASAPATPARQSPLVQVDRTVKKIVKSIRALRLPRVRLTALNSPHAAGPRRP